MEPNELDRLRARLGEQIPEDGDDTDTLFTNHQLSDLIDYADGDFEQAVLEGWRIKVATLSTLVDTSEGTSKRAMGDLRGQAQAVLTDLTNNSSASRRTRIHTLGRD